MKTVPPERRQAILLADLITTIIARCKPFTTKQNSSFINDVSKDIFLLANEKAFTAIVERLLLIIALCEQGAMITISARTYHDVLLVHIKVNNTKNSYGILEQLDQLQIEARELRGFLDVTSIRDKLTTISFTLLNMSENVVNAIIVDNQMLVKKAI